MEERKTASIENIKLFNDYLIETRLRIENFTKQVLLVSGGIQTITISAFLGGHAPALSASAISLLRLAWMELSTSTILCLVYMFLHILSQLHISRKHANHIKDPSNRPDFFDTSPAIALATTIVGLSAFLLCLHGIYTMSKAAVSVIGAVGA